MRARTLLVRVAPIVVVAAVTFACFVPSLDHELLTHRDERLLHRASTQTLEPREIVAVVTAPGAEEGPLPGYQPLTALSFVLDFRTWETDARGYHRVSVVLHALNAVLVYLLLAAFLRAARDGSPQLVPRLAAAGAALLWALHPLRVESVAWMSVRAGLLSTTLLLLAVLAYLRATAPPRPRGLHAGWWIASLAAAALAMLASAAAAVLPLVLLLLDAYPLRRLTRGTALRVVGEKLPYAALAAAVAILALGGENEPDAPLGARVAGAAYGICFYLWKSLAPLHLSPMYERVAPIDPLGWPYLSCLLAVAAITVALALAARRWPAGLTAWTAYLVLLAPHLGLDGQARPEIAADRYTYAATIPFAALAAAGFAVAGAHLGRRLARAAATTAVVAVLAALAVLTIRQEAIWQSAIHLWVHAVQLEPDNVYARIALGEALRNGGYLGHDVPHYEAVLAMADARNLDPARRARVAGYMVDGLNKLGQDALYEGDRERAIAQFEKALVVDPTRHRMRLNLAAVYMQVGRLDDAMDQIGLALAVDPTDERTLNALGIALMRTGQLDEAEQRFRQALAVAPDNAATRTNLGVVLRKLGRLDEAIHEWEEALRIDPDLVAARRHLEVGQRDPEEPAGDTPPAP